VPRARPLFFALVVLASWLWAPPARAYRPFDETDADVSALHELVLELGALGYTHDAAGGAYTPGFILNYGIVPRVELVFDAHHAILYGGADVSTRRRALETSMLAKGVVRRGCLQGEAGPSVAVEAGAILPTLPAEGGYGAGLTAIVSERWENAALHVDLEGDYTRAHTGAFIGGAIVEGPDRWTVRPVAEPLVAKERGTPAVLSLLGGAIWRTSDHLAVDGAVRAARQGDGTIYEVRAGLTWTVGL